MAGSALASVTTRPRTALSRGPFAEAVDGGVAYFRRRCDDQLPLVIDLRDAIASGDLTAAQHAYVESRPPYEEIETLAYAFEDSDRDIDARPYAFDGGETDAEFRGFHKIEVLLYAHEDLTAALPHADGLVDSVRRLRRELDEPSRFTAEGQFDGMIALSNEVSAKKISSEEETWSDQSLLIFRSNWEGIISQFRPFASVEGGVDIARSERVERAFGAAMDLVMPHFRDGTAAATPYSRIGIAERRVMADASQRLRDAVIDAGRSIGLVT
ncbi:MAG: EfeM/EfeO family lipoprotein [Planctomycetota bacterium]